MAFTNWLKPKIPKDNNEEGRRDQNNPGLLSGLKSSLRFQKKGNSYNVRFVESSSRPGSPAMNIPQENDLAAPTGEISYTDPTVADLLKDSDVPILKGQIINVKQTQRVFEGNHSDVYKGLYEKDDVAVKVIRSIGDATKTPQKLRKEIEIWWPLRHPNILLCLGFAEVEAIGNLGAILSPWCENGDIWRYLKTNPSLSCKAMIFRDVARGLHFLHQADPIVVHGDLKPDNVVIDKNLTAKICDFGVSRLIQQKGSTVEATTTMEQTGTTRYLSYELVEFDGLSTPASDVHAFGCVGLGLFYDLPPYSKIQSNHPSAKYKIYDEISRQMPPAARPDRLDEVTTRVWDLFEECWVILPERRPTTAKIISYLDDISGWISDSQMGTSPTVNGDEENDRVGESSDPTPVEVEGDPRPSQSQYGSPITLTESMTNPKLNQPFDPDVPIFVNLREEPVRDLSGRIREMSIRPFFEGAYANVWTAKLDGKEAIAIKHLRDQTNGEEKARRRFRREIGTWWCLRHENIVPLLGIAYNEKFGASPSIISPWYANGTAVAYLDPKNTVPVSQRIDLFHDVAKGLLYLHTFDMMKITVNASVDTYQDADYLGTKLVHGDLKPLNVLVDDSGRARISDISLLRFIREYAPVGMTTTTPHIGTTRCLSPELVDIEAEDPKPTTASDVWALACIGMEFIYAKPPYAEIAGNRPRKIMNAIESGKPPAKRPSNTTGVVPGLWDLFEQSWDTVPANRPDVDIICQYLEENRIQLASDLIEKGIN